MNHIPSLNGLKAFESAARHLSFKKGAEELYVTPAAISNQIKNLENSLDVKLFKRVNRRVELTDCGEKLLIRMRIIFDDIREATRDIIENDENTLVTLAIPHDILQYWFIPNLETIQNRLPNINLRIVDPTQYKNLNKKVDAAIHYGLGSEININKGHILDEELIPVCNPKILSNKTLSQPEDLEEFRLIYTDNCIVEWDNYLISAGYTQLNIHKKLRFSNTAHTLEATLKGLGVALLNPIFISKYLDSGELISPFKWNVKLSQKPCYYFMSNDISLKKREIKLLQEILSELAISTKTKHKQSLTNS